MIISGVEISSAPGMRTQVARSSFDIRFTAWTWGVNTNGQLGDNAGIHRSVPVQGLNSTQNWEKVAAGGSHFSVIKSDGTLWSWGLGTNGQLGDTLQADSTSPVQEITGSTNWLRIAAGQGHVAAIKTDGTLWCWGLNQMGQLGNNNAILQNSPVITIGSATNWQSVSAGGLTTAAIKTDGTLWTWGHNNYGQLGNNTEGLAARKSSPVQTIAGGTNWTKVSVSGSHVLALKTDGTLWAWGRNSLAALGDGGVINKSSPIQTSAGGTTWSQVSAGYNLSAGIKTDGTLWTWGMNGKG